MAAGFTLTDVTADTWATLSNPPDGSITPPHASALCLRDVATCRKETANRIHDKLFYARNRDWDPRVLPRMVTPMSWPFLTRPIFKKSLTRPKDVLNLDFVEAPLAGYTVKIYRVRYKAGAGLPPQFVAVAFPMDLEKSKAPPFLVHYKHIPGQITGPLFKYFDPLGYDWLAFEVWNWLVYDAARLPGGCHVVDMPFLSDVQRSFGFCYQLRRADKQYVLVLPHISRISDQGSGRLRDYQLYSAKTLRDILIEIQKDILPAAGDQLSHVAISANSSGCTVLNSFLTGNMAAMRADKEVATFMNDEFNELFVLDPPKNSGDGVINSMAGWLRLVSTRSGFKGKCVRFYTHDYTKNMTVFTGTKSHPFKRGEIGFWEYPARTMSLVYLPYDGSGNDVWQRTYDEILPNGSLDVGNVDFVHHAIPALCLTDAAARSLYV